MYEIGPSEVHDFKKDCDLKIIVIALATDMIKAYHLVPGITNYSSIPHWLLEFFLLHIFSYISHMMRKKISTVKFFSACMKDNKYLAILVCTMS